MSIAVLVIMVILGLITFTQGLPAQDKDSVMAAMMGPVQKPRVSLLAVGTTVVVIGILALAWVPALERLLG